MFWQRSKIRSNWEVGILYPLTACSFVALLENKPNKPSIKHRKLSLVLCDDLDGWEGGPRGREHMYTYSWFIWLNHTTLQNNCTPIKKKKHTKHLKTRKQQKPSLKHHSIVRALFRNHLRQNYISEFSSLVFPDNRNKFHKRLQFGPLEVLVAH